MTRWICPISMLVAVAMAQSPYELRLPAGWSSALDERSAIVARSGDRASLLLIAAVPGRGSAVDALRGPGAQVVASYLPGAVLTNVTASRRGAGNALAAFSWRGGRGQAMLAQAGGAATLYVIAAPAAQFDAQRGAMVEALRSFRFVAGSAGSGPALSYVKFEDPNERAFTTLVPAGWKTQGGTARRSAVDLTSWVHTVSPDGRSVVGYNDPTVPAFTLPTQMLAMAGIREGGWYSPGYGTRLYVSRYRPGAQSAQDYLSILSKNLQMTGVQVKGTSPAPDVEQLLKRMNPMGRTDGGRVDFTAMRNGAPVVGSIVAGTQLMMMDQQSGLWYLSFLAFGVAPVEESKTAETVAGKLIGSWAFNPQWVAGQQQTTGKVSQIVTQTSNDIFKMQREGYENAQRTNDRLSQQRSDTMRGVVRLKDPETGEQIEAVNNSNYFFRVKGTNAVVGNNDGTRPTQVDVTELLEIR